MSMKTSMKTNFEQVTDATALSAFLASSPETRVLLLHDPYCPISQSAWYEVTDAGLDVSWVDVSRERELSRDVERETGIRHQSPQVFVLRDGEVKWSASHGRITAEALQAAVQVE